LTKKNEEADKLIEIVGVETDIRVMPIMVFLKILEFFSYMD